PRGGGGRSPPAPTRGSGAGGVVDALRPRRSDARPGPDHHDLASPAVHRPTLSAALRCRAIIERPTVSTTVNNSGPPDNEYWNGRMSTTQERVDGAVGGGVDALRAILDRQRAAFMAEGPPGVAVRRNRIDRLLALVLDNADAFIDAMEADFGTRPKTGSLFTEVLGMISVIEHTRSHVSQWMRATKLMRAARLVGLKAEVHPSPLGVVGIIGPWNYPLQLAVLPASAAFAAGNRGMIQMSEYTPRTAELMKSAAPKYFDPNELDIVTGGPEVSVAFSRLPFDHLFFTGSPSVGALVQQAAAQNLVPVTLELGGKNPVVVSPDADIKR